MYHTTNGKGRGGREFFFVCWYFYIIFLCFTRYICRGVAVVREREEPFAANMCRGGRSGIAGMSNGNCLLVCCEMSRACEFITRSKAVKCASKQMGMIFL